VKQVFCTEAEVDQQVGDPTALMASSPSWLTGACDLCLPGFPQKPGKPPSGHTMDCSDLTGLSPEQCALG
jgi:hypothetical protein